MASPAETYRRLPVVPPTNVPFAVVIAASGYSRKNFEIAVDRSSEAEERERAIGPLETANECDSFAEIVGMGDLADRYREQALNALTQSQCEATFAHLAADDSLEASLRQRADSLLDETLDDGGAGP